LNKFIKYSHDSRDLPNTRFVFPESNDERVSMACAHLQESVDVIPIENFYPKIVDYFEIARRMEFTKNWPGNVLEKYLEHPLHLSMMMLNTDDVDHLIAGVSISQEDIIRTALRIIGLQNRHRWVFSSSLLISPAGDRKFTFADCSIVAEPTPEQLCSIAGETAIFHEKLTGEQPMVAFISFSTKGSFSHYRVDKVIKAHSLFQKKYPQIPALGEVQIDAAIQLESTEWDVDSTDLVGNANVLIFPNLDAGNVAYQLTKRLAGYHAAGSVIHGLKKRITLLSKKCDTDEIINTMIFASKLKGENAHLQLQM